ncbi:MAG: HAD hydrolase-like protein [Conexivisphaerales archaeon]
MQKEDVKKAVQNSNRKALILIDLDGTIVTSTFRNLDAKLEALRFLEKNLLANGLSLNDRIRDYFHVIKASPADTETKTRLIEELSELIERYELESVEKCELKEGAMYLLELFRGRVPIAIVSNSGKNAVKRSLERFGLTGTFDYVFHRDNLPDLKPSGVGLQMALQKFNVLPENAVMLGDTPMDILAAHEAKVTSIALTDGVGKKDELESAWPDYLMRNLKEAAFLLDRLWFS